MKARLISPIAWSDFEDGLGNIQLVLPCSPVSVQASAVNRQLLAAALRAVTRECPFLITSDVRVDIEWMVSERERYESDLTADVDNIIKPILDGLAGPEGLLVNDCQVQSVTSYWMDPTIRGPETSIRIQAGWGRCRVPRPGLFFVQFDRALCFPFDAGLPAVTLREMVRHIRWMLDERAKLEEQGGWVWGRWVMSVQRLFHRTRVSGFRVIRYEELDLALGSKL